MLYSAKVDILINLTFDILTIQIEGLKDNYLNDYSEQIALVSRGEHEDEEDDDEEEEEEVAVRKTHCSYPRSLTISLIAPSRTHVAELSEPFLGWRCRRRGIF